MKNGGKSPVNLFRAWSNKNISNEIKKAKKKGNIKLKDIISNKEKNKNKSILNYFDIKDVKRGNKIKEENEISNELKPIKKLNLWNCICLIYCVFIIIELNNKFFAIVLLTYLFPYSI